MRRRSENLTARYALALCVAVGLHLLLANPISRLIPEHKPAATPLEPRPMPMRRQQVRIVSERERARMMARLAPAPPPKIDKQVPPPEPPKIKKESPSGQVVEIPMPKREEVPDQARFRSEFNSKVEKEQVARDKQAPSPRMRKSDRLVFSHGDDPDGNTRAERIARKKQPQSNRPEADEEREGKARISSPTLGDPSVALHEATPRLTEPESERLRLALEEGQYRMTPEAASMRRTAGGEGPRGGAPVPADYTSLLPNLGPKELARKQGSIDHVEDVDEGDDTALNTREYKYASFFNRVKRSVQERWGAVDAHRRRDPYGRVYGVRDQVTIVEVTLKPDGTLEDVFLRKDSGVAFLDEVAMQAFRDAQPFPNPPAGLQDPDGRIRFRFGFYLEINGRGFRMFRSQ